MAERSSIAQWHVADGHVARGEAPAEPTTEYKRDYLQAHRGRLEQSLSDALNGAILSQAADPIGFCSTYLAEHAIPGDSAIEQLDPASKLDEIKKLRDFLASTARSVEAATKALDKLQGEGHPTSRAGYLKALPEIIGPDPRPFGETSRALWMQEWRLMYEEYAASTTHKTVDVPTSDAGWRELEAKFETQFETSVRTRTDRQQWGRDHAEAYTWLSSIEARGPMAHALLTKSRRYATATYALIHALASRADQDHFGAAYVLSRCGTYRMPPMTFRALSMLVDEHAPWGKLEEADANGFRGLTSPSLVRPSCDPKYFSSDGMLTSAGAADFHDRSAAAPTTRLVDSDVVGFASTDDDEHGMHRGLSVSSTSTAFPPNTLFRLQRVVPPGEWEAPGGVRPERRLLVVSATFRLADVTGGAVLSSGAAKMAGSNRQLTYASRQTYVKGMGDVLDRPLLTMEQEWRREHLVWYDRTRAKYSATVEWAYVNGPVPGDAADAQKGGGVGERDGNNRGKAPGDFLAEANAHVRAMRAHFPDVCCGLPDEHCELTLDEVLSIRLYTGPGYAPVNDFLRQLGRLDRSMRSALAHNPAVTLTATVGHICRAIRKLAAVTPPAELDTPLYRGVRGELPASFWTPDEQGMLMAVDCGFMSTSRDVSTAVEYMVPGGGTANVLWRLTPSAESDTAYHRGAPVRMLSQFASEEEVLFPPCTMLVVHARGDGGNGGGDGDGSGGDVPANGATEQQRLRHRSTTVNFAFDRTGGFDGVRAKVELSHEESTNSRGKVIGYEAITVKPFFI